MNAETILECSYCGQSFSAESDIEDIGDDFDDGGPYGDPIEAMGEAHEMDGGASWNQLPDASPADVDYLFGIPPSPYPDFGSF